MNYTTNFNLNKPEGTDLYNHLTIDNPNMDIIDGQMQANKLASVGAATELVSGTVHAITRSDSNQNIFKFKATGDFHLGDTITVDGVSVNAYTTAGQQLLEEAYVLSAEVLCILDNTNLWVLVNKVPDGSEVAYDANDSVNDKIDASNAAIIANRVRTEAGWKDITGVSGGWVTENITFNTPFNITPLVSVSHYQTAYANTWPMPAIDNITPTGFTMSWYNASGTRRILWQAVGR